MLSKALLAAALASSATAFLLPPQMDMESAMNEVSKASDNAHRHHRPADVSPPRKHGQPDRERIIGSVPCPGCPVAIFDPMNPEETTQIVTDRPTRLMFLFKIDHAESGDRLLLNDYELYPNVGLSGEVLTAQQRQSMPLPPPPPPHHHDGPPFGGPREGHEEHHDKHHKEHHEHEEHKDHEEHKEHEEPQEAKEPEEPKEPKEPKELEGHEEVQELKKHKKYEEKEAEFPRDIKKLKSHFKFPGLAAWKKGKHGEHKNAEDGMPPPPPHGHHFPPPPHGGPFQLPVKLESVPLGYMMQRTQVNINDSHQIVLTLQVNNVRNTEIEGIPAVSVTLTRTPAGALQFQSIQTLHEEAKNVRPLVTDVLDRKAHKLAECTNSICRWLVMLEFQLKSKGCGGKKAGGKKGVEGMEGMEGMEIDGAPDMAGPPPPADEPVHGHHHHHHPHPHHYPGHHMPFHGMREHSWGQMVKKFSSHILMPVLIGIAAGIMVSFVGMLVGSVLVSVWRMLFRRGSRSSSSSARRQARQHRHHHRRASKAVGREDGDMEEKAGLMAAAETDDEVEEVLPVYKEEEEENKEVAVVAKPTTATEEA